MLKRLKGLFGKRPKRMPLFFIEDNTGTKIGYTYKDGETQVLIDLKGNTCRVPRNTSIKYASRFLLKHLYE